MKGNAYSSSSNSSGRGLVTGRNFQILVPLGNNNYWTDRSIRLKFGMQTKDWPFFHTHHKLSWVDGNSLVFCMTLAKQLLLKTRLWILQMYSVYSCDWCWYAFYDFCMLLVFRSTAVVLCDYNENTFMCSYVVCAMQIHCHVVYMQGVSWSFSALK